MPRWPSIATVASNFGERPAEAVKANHRERVPLARIGEKGLQSRPIHRLARAHVGEDLDGTSLFETHHGTSLKIDTHFVDTGGVSDHVFILCALLGFRFCPRLRDFPDRKLACIEPLTTYPGLQSLFGRRIKVDVIREHWNEVVQLVASLKAGTVAPSVMLKKLAAYERQNQLDLALQEMGASSRTLFMLDWLESPELRRRCHVGLNKGEQRHALTQAICTFKQGRIADRGVDAQQYRASGLNLLIAGIVY